MHLSFKFKNRERNSTLVGRLKSARVHFTIGSDGTIKFLAADEEAVERALSSVRNEVFPKWQVVFSPAETLPQYREYMERHNVPYEEETSDGKTNFLVPRQYRPHSWRFRDAGTYPNRHVRKITTGSPRRTPAHVN